MTMTIQAALQTVAVRDDRAPAKIWPLPSNLYEKIMGTAVRKPLLPATNILSVSDVNNADPNSLLKTVRTNIVQSIRAFRALELSKAASFLGQHFLYADCANAQSRSEVLDIITNSFLLTKQYGKNFDALGSCLTDVIHKCGPQPGFIIVLEGLPCAPKFDKEARETLLDVFRDAADFWQEKKIAFRVFYAFV